jgi:hypothetical protein
MEVGAVFSFMWLFFVSLSITQFHGGFDGVGAVRVHYRSHYCIIMLINANDRTKARKRDGATTAMQSFLRERTI